MTRAFGRVPVRSSVRRVWSRASRCASTSSRTILQQIPTPLNPLGVKGLGEGGAVGAHAAVAMPWPTRLWPLGIEVRTTPLSPGAVGSLLLAGTAKYSVL
jgi:hypothetical protein